MEKKINKKQIMSFIIWIILFATYNVSVFTIGGFTGHSATYWLSYSFMLVAMIAVSIFGILLGLSGLQLKDWLFGFPIVRHCATYIIVETVASILFMVLDKIVKWQIAFAIQFILLAVCSVFVISCFISKTVITETQESIKRNTSFMTQLRIDSKILAEGCKDKELAKKLYRFADEVMHSDIVSNESLNAEELQLKVIVDEMKTFQENGNIEPIFALCDKATLLLSERNEKTKAMK